MGETLPVPSREADYPPPPKWQIEAGQFEPRLHTPSREVIAALVDKEAHLPVEAQRRVAAWGLLTHTLQLLNPKVSHDKTELDQLRSRVSKAIMYSGKLAGEQRSQLDEILRGLAGPVADNSELAIGQALAGLRDAGVEDEVISLADSAVTVLRIWEREPSIKLPVPYNS